MVSKGISIKLLGTDDFSLTKKLCEIDMICFGNIDVRDEGTEKYWVSLNHHCFTFAIFDNQNVFGYIDFLKISDESIPFFRFGKVHDGELFEYADKSENKIINLYLISVCILPEFRNRGLAKSLWNYASLHFNNNGYIIKSLFATIWTSDGSRLLGKFEHEIISKDAYDHPIVSIKCKDGMLSTFP